MFEVVCQMIKRFNRQQFNNKRSAKIRKNSHIETKSLIFAPKF